MTVTTAMPQAVYDVVSECVEGMRKVWSNSGSNMQKGGRECWQFAVVGHIGLELCEWLRDAFNLQQQVVTSALTFSTLFKEPPAVVGTTWADDCNTQSRWKIQVDDFYPTKHNQTGHPWKHNVLLVVNEFREGAVNEVWKKINETARQHRVVVVIQEPPSKTRRQRDYYRRDRPTGVECTELALLPPGTICFGHAAGWPDYSDAEMPAYSHRTRHTHTWTQYKDRSLVPPTEHLPGILRRHEGMLNKRDVRILLLAPKAESVAALSTVLPADLRKLAYLLGGTGGCGSHNTRDGPAWYGGGRSIRLDWVIICRVTRVRKHAASSAL